jgi:hypothetical protein
MAGALPESGPWPAAADQDEGMDHDMGQDTSHEEAPDGVHEEIDDSALPELQTYDPCFEGKMAVGNTVTTVLGPIEELLGQVHVEYQWMRDGEDIPGATSKSYTLTEEDGGANVAVRITASKPGYRTEERISCTRKISAKPAAVRARPVRIAGSPKVGRTVKVVGPSWGKRVRMQYRWTCDHDTIKVTSKPRLTLGPEFAGCRVSVAVRGFAKGKASAVKVSNHPEVQGMAMTLGAVTLGISTTAGPQPVTEAIRAGTLLQATLAQPQTYPDFAVEWQWLRDGVPIPDQIADTYLVAWADAGRTISAQAIATATGYEDATSLSEPVAVPEATQPKPPPDTRRPLPPRTPAPDQAP